ncbi:hypothetical protein LINPERHAP1_LOCUS21480 [Linum perenne]
MEFSSSEVSIVLETQFPTIKGGDISPLPSFESMISSLENTRPRFLKTISSLDWTSTLRFSRLFEGYSHTSHSQVIFTHLRPTSVLVMVARDLSMLLGHQRPIGPYLPLSSVDQRVLLSYHCRSETCSGQCVSSGGGKAG